LKWELLEAPHLKCGKGEASIELLLLQAVAPVVYDDGKLAVKPLFLHRARHADYAMELLLLLICKHGALLLQYM